MEKEAIVFRTTPSPDYGDVVYEREFPSEPDLVPAVVFRLINFLVEEGYQEEGRKNQLSLCFDEAVKNAILHGNRSVPSLQVSVKVHGGSDNYWVVIRDEGDGFDLAEVPDPVGEEGIWNEGGRGIHLMQHYSTEMEYSDGGSTLALCFPRYSPGGDGNSREVGE
jgi:serine/threonine-protein kinase RsbW